MTTSFEEALKVLREMSYQHKSDSNILRSLKYAAIAVIFANQPCRSTEFVEFINSFHDELTTEQREALHDMGIERQGGSYKEDMGSGLGN